MTRYNTGPMMGQIKKDLKWADGSQIKTEIDSTIAGILGAKTDADNKPVEKVRGKFKTRLTQLNQPDKSAIWFQTIFYYQVKQKQPKQKTDEKKAAVVAEEEPQEISFAGEN